MHPDDTRRAGSPSTTPTTQSTRVVHVKDAVPGAVYIGRSMPRQGLKASKWANPYKIGPECSRDEAIRRYSADLLIGDKRPMLAELPELRNRPLACWCRHDGEPHRIGVNDCHADVLAGFLRTYSDAALVEMANDPKRGRR